MTNSWTFALQKFLNNKKRCLFLTLLNFNIEIRIFKNIAKNIF